MGTSEPSEPVAKLNKESNASQGHIAESLNESGYDVREDQVQNAVAFLSHPKVVTGTEKDRLSNLPAVHLLVTFRDF